jgi:hypothetical protein
VKHSGGTKDIRSSLLKDCSNLSVFLNGNIILTIFLKNDEVVLNLALEQYQKYPRSNFGSNVKRLIKSLTAKEAEVLFDRSTVEHEKKLHPKAAVTKNTLSRTHPEFTRV